MNRHISGNHDMVQWCSGVSQAWVRLDTDWLACWCAVLWSYAKLDHKHEALFAAAAEHATRTIQTFQPQSMASRLTNSDC